MNKKHLTLEQKRHLSDTQKAYWESLSPEKKESIKAKRLAARLKSWEELKAFRKVLALAKENKPFKSDSWEENMKLIDKHTKTMP